MDSVLAQIRKTAHQSALRAGIWQLLTENNLKIGQFAQKLGLKSSHLEKQLLRQESLQQRPISHTLVTKIKKSREIFISSNLYNALMFHAGLAIQEQETLAESLLDENPMKIMGEVSELRMQSLHSESPEDCAAKLELGLEYGSLAVERLLQKKIWYESGRIALVLHDLSRTANQLPKSAYWAQLAQQLFEQTDEQDALEYQINAIYAEAATIRLLGQPKRAIIGFERVKAQGKTTPWAVHAERERLMSELMLPQFDFSKWHTDWKKHHEISRDLPSEITTWDFTLQRIHAQALLQSKQRKQALDLLISLESKANHPSNTVVTRVGFFRFFGQAWCEQTNSRDDLEIGMNLLRRADTLATRANLTHQKQEIWQILRQYVKKL